MKMKTIKASQTNRSRAMNEHSFYLRPLQLGLSLGISLVVAYLVCLALAIIVPDRGPHQARLCLDAAGDVDWRRRSFRLRPCHRICIRADRKLFRDCSRRLKRLSERSFTASTWRRRNTAWQNGTNRSGCSCIHETRCDCIRVICLPWIAGQSDKLLS